MEILFRDAPGTLLDATALQQRMPDIGAPHCLPPDELAARGYEVVEVIPPPALGDAQAYGEPELVRDGDRLTLVTPVIDAPPALVDPSAEILARMLELEAQQTPRRVREAALTEAGRLWLADLDAQIAALRSQLNGGAGK